MENDRRASRGDGERYDLEILFRRPSLRTNIPRRVSRVCRDEIPTEDTNCGAGCIRGRWLQSFANRNSFTLIYGILGSFYGSYYAYFYGTISTLEKGFQISSLTIGIIAATSDFVQIITCFLLSKCLPNRFGPKWIGFGVFLIVASTVVFTLPHFLYKPHEPGNITRSSTYLEKEPDQLHRTDEPKVCTNHLQEGNGPFILLILAQSLHGIGGSFYFLIGKIYKDDNIEKYKPPALLSLLSVLKILGPAFGYWLSSLSLKIFEYPETTPRISEDEPRWIGAWWLGSPVIGFVLIVPGILVTLFPTTLPKTAVRRIQNKLKGDSENKPHAPELIGQTDALKKFFNFPTITYTHFASIFNILGFISYFIFLPKYVEIQFRISASNANLITGSTTLIASAVGVVTANSVITRYRPSARALASWTLLVGVLSIGGLVSYIFIDCQPNDQSVRMMIRQHLNTTCDTPFFPVCDENNNVFISLCHAGCKSILDINNTLGYESCGYAELPSRKVFRGFCAVDCYTSFLKFTFITCSITFLYATGRASNFWFETKSEENKGKSLFPLLEVVVCLLATIPAPIVFGYLINEACLLWDGNCEWSGNCWLYDNEKLRFNMNLTAIGFAVIGILFDVGVWFSVKNLDLFDDSDYYTDENYEK